MTARDEFIAVAAHELRNPMTPILAQVHRLAARARREACSETFVAGLELLETAVDHYIRRANTLLEVSRLNAGLTRVNPQSVDMVEVVKECARSYELFAARTGTQLQCQLPEHARGVWDPLAIEQILDNLVSNAIRYGDGKPIDVALVNDEDFVLLTVTDRGIGIAPEDQARIFQRFEQASGGRTSGGFGVGLWLARQLVEAHGGTLNVKSMPGCGSAFSVRLPRYASTGMPAE